MKGIESVIAIILILMITVALAALAYVWFTGVFQQLTTGAGQAAGQAGQAIATQFSIETAKFNISNSNKVHVVIRNTGTVVINTTVLAAFIDNELMGIQRDSTTAVNPNEVEPINITTSAGGTFTTSQVGRVLKITGTGGISQTTTIS